MEIKVKNEQRRLECSLHQLTKDMGFLSQGEMFYKPMCSEGVCQDAGKALFSGKVFAVHLETGELRLLPRDLRVIPYKITATLEKFFP